MRLRPLLLTLSFATAAGAQTSERGAIILLRGTDTVVIDRFIHVRDTLKGIVQVRGQPRIEYLAVLTPDGGVQTLLVGVARLGAPDTEAPVQRMRMTVVGDTVLAQTQSGGQTLKIASKTGAIPMFTNALALSELYTRRAAASGGAADLPYFAVFGEVTLKVTVRPGQADTVAVALAQQGERLKVDAQGRILGGVIDGTKLQFARGGPDLAAASAFFLHF